MGRLRYNGLTATLGAALPIASSSYSGVVLADSPVVYYRQGDTTGSTMTDSSGNGHNGFYNGSPTLASTSLLNSDSANKAVTLVSGAWGQTNTVNAYFPAPSFYTIEAWIKPTAVSGVQTIAAKADNGGYPWQFQLSGANLQLIHNGAGTAATTNSPIAAGGVYHVVGTYDGTTIKLYINGALVASAASATGFSNSNNFYIGSDFLGSGGFSRQNQYAGVIDEVAAYSAALSAAQVASHYNAGAGQPPTGVTFSAALTYNNGTAVPTVASPDYIPLTLLDASGNLSEIVWLTSYTSGATTGFVTRAQEGTSVAGHASGDKLLHAPSVVDFQQSPYAAKASDYTLVATDHTVNGDATNGTLTFTLPSAVGCEGKSYVLRKADASGYPVIVATTSAQTINGSATRTLTSQFQVLRVESDGANWMIDVPTPPPGVSLSSVRAKRTSGDVTLNSSTFTNVDTGLDLVVPAKAGDVIELGLSGRVDASSGSTYAVFDFHTIVGGTPVNSVSSESAASTTVSPSFNGYARGYVDATPQLGNLNGRKQYTVKTADLSNGTVTFRLRVFSGASIVVRASDPGLYVDAVNLTQAGRSSAMPVVQASRSDGSNYTLNATTDTAVDTGLDVTVPAAVGDVLLVNFNMVIGGSTGGGDNVNFTAKTRVSGADVSNIAGSGYVPSWFAPDALSTISGIAFYTVQAADIANGTVTLRLYYKADSSGPRTGFATSSDATQFGVVNFTQGGGFLTETPRSVGGAGQPAFTNSWANLAGYAATFWKDAFGVVHLNGQIAGGSSGNSAFTLPVGYRPAVDTRLASCGYSGSSEALTAVRVGPNGQVIPVILGSTSTGLDGISFLAQA